MGEGNKKGKPTGTETDSSSIWGRMRKNGAAIQAIATAVLVLVTIYYAVNTQIQVNNQVRQFNIINSPAIIPAMMSGNITGGTVVFFNVGVLPAKDFKLIWQYIRVSGKEVKDIYPKERSKDDPLSQTIINVVSHGEIVSKQSIQITYESEFGFDEQVVFLIIAWKYKGEGMKKPRTDSAHFNWYVKKDKGVGWALNNYLGEDHREVVKSKKVELIQFLEQDEIN